VVLPMMPYARQDRKDSSRQPITAKLMADLLQVAGSHHIMTMDLHAAQIQGFFDVPVDNLYGLPTLMDHLAAHVPWGFLPVRLVSPDVGGAKRALGALVRLRKSAPLAELVIMHKNRHADGSVSQVILGEVSGCACVIVDDLGDTCGTLCNAAAELKAAGAASVSAFVTHGVFSKGAVKRIADDSAIDRMYVTDTCCAADFDPDSKFTTLSVAPVFAEAIDRDYRNKSVSCLF
jgi:ribose-phosphate pyrophosphokinase